MLTKEQLKKLQPLTKHLKYGPIVKAAIVGWKRCRPINGAFGITLENFKFRRSKHFKGCCFLGAALLGRKSRTPVVSEAIYLKFKLSSFDEMWALSDGFENDKCFYHVSVKEPFNFGKKVRKALGI